MVISMIMNFKKICEKLGIHEFSRTRGGWMKLVEGYDKSEYGGYRFVGSNFVKVGNFDSDLPNGLYLDQSTSVVDGEKVLTMNLFKITDGEVELLASTPKCKGWAYKLEGVVEDFFANDETTALDVLNTVRDMTCNRDVLHEVGRELLKEERQTVWLNHAHFGAYMQDACVYNADYLLNREEIQEIAVKLYLKDGKARKYFNYEIDNDHELRMVYAFIHCRMKKYSDFEIVYEDIAEDYYLQMSHLKELRDFNYNEISRGATHDVGHWISFNTGIYATESIIYIIAPNIAREQILVQRMRFQHRFNQK